MKQGANRYEPIARWLGITLTPQQRALLSRYEEWLADEAMAAGGIGPHEEFRLFDRHVADSLAYCKGLPETIETIADIGGGVGLPSIPMAVAFPDTAFTLVDRSERRTRLARRAVRILGLENLVVTTTDVSRVTDTFDVVTFRASVPVGRAAALTLKLTSPGGLGLFGVSRLRDRPKIPGPPDGIAFSLSSEGSEVLDSPFWLLRMYRI
ncbi:MAG: hypothetical protein BMS9Abin20_1183 [Acidimicrobiia bacterium]|nr:MAG: hypothetical protein BMS9Abin20_1183 [Acidimicrobiia bacterium]